MNVGYAGVGSVLEIDPSSGLNFHSTGKGYFTLDYDFVAAGGAVDLTHGGHDRIRMVFGDITSPTISIFGMSVTTAPGSTNYGVSTYLGDWDGVVLELPFASLPATWTAAQKFRLDIARNPPGKAFALRSITTASPPLAGDYNRDGTVDNADYLVWRQYIGISTKTGITYLVATADGDGNGVVDASDYVVWRNNAGSSAASASTESHALPEPAGLLLVLCALVCWLSFRLG
jgi:hypothetical protein